MQFCATAPGFQPRLKQLIVQQPKDKGSSPSALWEQCVEVWVVMQITNCTGHRGKREGNGSLSARHAEGGTDWCEPPSLLCLSVFILLFHSLCPKLAAGRQMNAVWSETNEVQGPAVQATKELHARHLLFSYQNTFSHVPPFPLLLLRSSSTTALQHPFCQVRAVPFFLPNPLQRHSSSDHSSTDTAPILVSFTHLPP